MCHFSWQQYSGKQVKKKRNDLSQQLQQLSKLINFDRWAEELTDLHVYVKLFNKENITPLKRITKVSIICDVLKTKIMSRRCLPEINMLLKAALLLLLQFQQKEVLASLDASRCDCERQ